MLIQCVPPLSGFLPHHGIMFPGAYARGLTLCRPGGLSAGCLVLFRSGGDALKGMVRCPNPRSRRRKPTVKLLHVPVRMRIFVSATARHVREGNSGLAPWGSDSLRRFPGTQAYGLGARTAELCFRVGGGIGLVTEGAHPHAVRATPVGVPATPWHHVPRGLRPRADVVPPWRAPRRVPRLVSKWGRCAQGYGQMPEPADP